jgi:hypothetical protein
MADKGITDILADLAKSALGGAKDVVASKPVSAVTGAGSFLSNILVFFSGALDGKNEDGTDNRDNSKKVAMAASGFKAAKAFSDFVGNKQTAPQTVGQLAESLTFYMNFKDDVDNKGDGPMWAATKSLIIGKVVGFIAEKVAEGLFSHSTSLQNAADTLRAKGVGKDAPGGSTVAPPPTPAAPAAATAGLAASGAKS